MHLTSDPVTRIVTNDPVTVFVGVLLDRPTDVSDPVSRPALLDTEFQALVRLDTVNGADPEKMRNRADFAKLTPLYPQERLRLETEPHILSTRVIDLVAPLGKGQRGMIVSPSKAGNTMIMQ